MPKENEQRGKREHERGTKAAGEEGMYRESRTMTTDQSTLGRPPSVQPPYPLSLSLSLPFSFSLALSLLTEGRPVSLKVRLRRWIIYTYRLRGGISSGRYPGNFLRPWFKRGRVRRERSGESRDTVSCGTLFRFRVEYDQRLVVTLNLQLNRARFRLKLTLLITFFSVKPKPRA